MALNNYIIFKLYKNKSSKNIIFINKKNSGNIGKVIMVPKKKKKIIKKGDLIFFKKNKKKKIYFFEKKIFFIKYKEIILVSRNGK